MCIEKMQPSTVFHGNQSDTLVQLHFPQSQNNMRKVFTLTRQNMQCLQLRQSAETSERLWLNDEVSGLSLYQTTVMFAPQVINAYCGLIAKTRNMLQVWLLYIFNLSHKSMLLIGWNFSIPNS